MTEAPKPSSPKQFLYRVEATSKSGKRRTFLAEIVASLDETARRRIIAAELREGGSVQSIEATEDRTKQDGDAPKRNYH